MIARIWRGRTRESDQNTYFEYLQRTGLKDYASILAIAVSGCCGVFMKVRRSSRSYRCGIHGMRSKPLLVLSMKRRSIIPRTRSSCWNSSRMSRTARFCTQAQPGLISHDKMPRWPYISIPAMEADIRFAMVPANMARTPRRASSPFLFGASAPIPPI